MIERVIAIPRNGYLNRLQAWASSAVLAEQLGASLSVLWDYEDIATTPADALFSYELLKSTFITKDEVESLLGAPHEAIPRYLTIDERRSVLRLAGHDRGEQVFMNDLRSMIHQGDGPSSLVIIAGGKFCLPGTINFDERRSEFYRSLRWSNEIVERTAKFLNESANFVALHVRETDRSIDAPTHRDITRALQRLKNDGPCNSLFVSADTQHARQEWMRVATDVGFRPWHSQNVEFDRSSSLNGVSAFVDWQLLSMAMGVIYPSASTFSSEAVVASGMSTYSTALRPSPVRRFGRSLLAPLRSR